MQKQFLPGWPIYGQGTPGNTGDGIRMAQQVGAALWHMNNAAGRTGRHRRAGVRAGRHPDHLVRPEIHPRRQARQALHGPRIGRAATGSARRNFSSTSMGSSANSPGCRASRSSTKGFARKARWSRPQPIGSSGGSPGTRATSGARTTARRSRRAGSSRARTHAELATKLGMKPADLEATITQYNENCKNGVDPDFGRPKDQPDRASTSRRSTR